jgi:hypothetical protein
MATKGQLEFIADIEAGVCALIAENSSVKQITQVLDKAGYKTADLAPYVQRLTMGEDWDCIERLAEAFLRVNLIPPCITKALERSTKSKAVLKLTDLDSEPLELDRAIPVEEPEEKEPEPVLRPFVSHHRYSKVRVDDAAARALSQNMAILDPLNPMEQKKVIGSLMVWYEVGV